MIKFKYMKMENKNFIDNLDSDWSEVISSTYKDSTEQPILKISFVNFDTPNKLEIRCKHNTYKFDIKDNMIFNIGLCEIEHRYSNLDGKDTSNRLRTFEVTLSKFRNGFLIIDDEPLKFKEEDLEEIYEKFDIIISLVDDGEGLKIWSLNFNEMLASQNHYKTFIGFGFNTFEEQIYLPNTSVNQFNKKFYDILIGFINEGIGSNPSNYSKQYINDLKKFII